MQQKMEKENGFTINSTTTPSSSALEEYMIEDTWLTVLDYLQLSDVYNLLPTSKKIFSMIDTETAYERRARFMYPLSTIQPNNISKYKRQEEEEEKQEQNQQTGEEIDDSDKPWKRLLQDGNGKNGLYVKTLHKVSYCLDNNEMNMFYVNSIRYMIWDKQEKTISLIIEAFGHEDLRTGLTTSLFRLSTTLAAYITGRTTTTTVTKIDPIRTKSFVPIGSPALWFIDQSDMFRDKHDLCQLVYPEEVFCHPGNEYKFTYNGSPTIEGSDYECVTFLKPTEVQPLERMFRIAPGTGTDNSNNCQFVPREEEEEEGTTTDEGQSATATSSSSPDTSSSPSSSSSSSLSRWWMKPSNILEWSGVNIPDRFRRLHEQGRWGNPAGTVPVSARQPRTQNELFEYITMGFE